MDNNTRREFEEQVVRLSTEKKLKLYDFLVALKAEEQEEEEQEEAEE